MNTEPPPGFGVISPEHLEALCIRGRQDANENQLPMAMALWAAKWTAEAPPVRLQCGMEVKGDINDYDIMSYYWRRPPKMKNRPGRLYLSTQQAYNAMEKG